MLRDHGGGPALASAGVRGPQALPTAMVVDSRTLQSTPESGRGLDTMGPSGDDETTVFTALTFEWFSRLPKGEISHVEFAVAELTALFVGHVLADLRNRPFVITLGVWRIQRTLK
jgi:hypothetical protein